MHIAYLIMTNKNPLHLKRLLSALQYRDVDFFIHIDKKSTCIYDIPQWENITILNNPVPVYWGGFSQVEATIRLIKAARNKKKYDYYILLSGSDYPVRSNKHISTYFTQNKGKEFINISKMPLHDKTFDRIEYFYLEGSSKKIFSLMSQIMNKSIRKLGIKRIYPKKYSKITLYGGCTWWGLTDSCIDYIMHFIDENPEYISFYKHTLCSDEMFFHTIIGN